MTYNFLPCHRDQALRTVHAQRPGACQGEWKLLCGTHNLLKLWRAATAPNG